MTTPEPPALEVSNDAIVRTYDRISGVYDLFVGPLEAPARSRAIDFLDPGDERILEVGCGPGHALVELARRMPGGHVYGLDAAPGMLDRARRRCERTDGARAGVADRVSLLVGDARALPVRDGAVDSVFVEATLELFSPSELRTVLAEAARVLGPDGRLCAVTMEREGSEDSRFVRLYERLFDTVPWYQRVGCRPVYARRTLEETGYTVERSIREYHLGIWPVDIYLARPG